jgi:hypothetical protein
METVSFRLDENLRGSLDEEARKVGTSLNALASQIFQRHTSWGRYADGLGLIPVSKDLLRSVFQRLSSDEIVEIARESAIYAGSEHVLFLFQQISFGTVLRFLDLWRAHFDASQHRSDLKRHFYTIHHDVNRNYSLFVKEYVNALIQATIPRSVSFENVSPNAVTFSFEG